MIEENLKFISQNQLSSVMNKTKWRELALAMTTNDEFEPKVRLKYLRDKKPMPGFSLLDWEWVMKGESSCIEWMIIDPIRRERRGQLVSDLETDFSEFVENELRKNNIPFSMEDGKFKVWGYTWPNEQPTFV